MTTIQGDIAVGSGVPPAALVKGEWSYVHVRPVELVTTSSGVTMLPFPSPTQVEQDGTFEINIPPLPTGFAYEIWFEVATRFKSPSRFVKIPSSGTVQYKDLVDVVPPAHAGWGAPSWVAEILTIIANGGGGGGGGTPTWGAIIGTLANQTDLQSALNAKVPTSRTVNGKALSANITLAKSDVGLGSAEDTADADKPISTAVAAALLLKADASALSTKADTSALTSGLAGKADLVGGVIPTAQLPALAVSDFLGEVESQSAMLALTGQRGDWAVRTDITSLAILKAEPSSTLANWVLVQLGAAAAGVTSVNTQSGIVVLAAADVGARPDTWVPDAADVVGLDDELAAKADLSGGTVPIAQMPAAATLTIRGDVARPTDRTDVVVQWIHTSIPAEFNYDVDIWNLTT